MDNRRRSLLESRLRSKLLNKDVDIDINFIIDRTLSYFLNFTNLSEVPSEADILIYDMAIRMMTDDGALEDDSKDVKQIKRGDTTITYADDSRSQSFFNDFYSRLIHFRTLNIPKEG